MKRSKCLGHLRVQQCAACLQSLDFQLQQQLISAAVDSLIGIRHYILPDLRQQHTQTA
ncbi:hypothetical protein D3C81_2154990 [compost metagenome]